MAHRLLDSRGRPSQSSASAFSHIQGRAAAVFNTVMGRAECVATAENPGLCEKPAISTQSVTWIIVGVVIGLLVTVTLSVMLFFHLKKRKRDRQEDVNDPFALDDYGVAERGGAGRAKPQGRPRLSFDDLPQPGAPNGGRNPFSDTSTPNRSAEGLNGPNSKQSWPKRTDSSESSGPGVPPQK
ncbi:hypothetical protein B0T16DRAFT_456058 [Cercophora newfieldiana]|uniref:Uncharacterized protein n=1 Tax=Cercophora newfieldiana TaxID=92897 RepID=A0AA40CRD1_9PEZI|nr:hypothetical protein B0T16DRAFT_456058 [Cercophora newfieldiana]